MRILYLKLKNFASIYAGMNTHSIEIDFNESKNRIVLLNGPNGSGKTSILSCLHPFANNGNSDIRNETALIIAKKEGYKEIHIQDGDSVYIIKHFFYPSGDSHNVKSYISKDGEELNPNGNVTSFKAVIQDELDLELDYLKLLRLGANVTDFIGLKTTERKTFMGKILEEVDIYLSFFKKITGDIRQLKSILSHTTDKLNKLNISDIEDIKHREKSLSEKIGSIAEVLMELRELKAVAEHEIKKITDSHNIKDEISELRDEEKSLLKILSKIKVDISNAEEKIPAIRDEIYSMKGRLAVATSNRAIYLNQMNDLCNEESSLRINLAKEENNEEIQALRQIVDDLERFVFEESDKHANWEPKHSSQDIKDLIVLLEYVQKSLNITYEFGKEPIKKVIKIMKKNNSVPEFISQHLSVIVSNRLSIASNTILDILYKKFPIVYPECDDDSCVIYQLWRELNDLTSKEVDKEVESEEFYSYMNSTYNNIQSILQELSSKKDLFRRMPSVIQEMFRLDILYNNIANCRMVYNQEVIYNELTKITEYEIYINNIAKLQKAHSDLRMAENSSNKAMIINRLGAIESTKKDISNKLGLMEGETIFVNNSLDTMEKKLHELELAHETSKSLQAISDSLRDLVSKHNATIKYESQLEILDKRIQETVFEKEKIEKELSDMKFKIKEFKILSKDLKTLNDNYEDLDTLKKSLSSTEGIPLLFIKLYLKNTRDITNKLLDIVYTGELSISDFNISENEFSIPFTKNDTLISDARFASQGERSFISVALSFALSYQSLTRYNIMLLDEIDSALDESNREKFLRILEHQMDMIDSEQIFLISHNNMFDMYPVDVIQTGGKFRNTGLNNQITIKLTV